MWSRLLDINIVLMIRINELIILTKLKQYDAPNTSLRLFIYLLIMIRISFRVKRDASGDGKKRRKAMHLG
jgi:hypothetical protein